MTAKQKRFCQEYLIDLNATQAAIRTGYSAKSAYSCGQRMLKKAEIKKYIEKQLQEICNEKTATAQEVMIYLTSVMRGEQKEEIPLFCGDGMQEIAKKEVSAKERLKAAELLGKRFGLFTEKLELSGNTSVSILDDIPEVQNHD